MAKLNVVETSPPEFRIQKDVPVPQMRRAARESKYPFKQMLPGDSFFVPDITSSALGTRARIWTERCGLDRTYTSRTVEGGARIWRVT